MRLFTRRFYSNFKTIKDDYVGKPFKYMEIGVFLGHTAEWFIDNVLTHPEAEYHGIDPWEWFKPFHKRFPTEEAWNTNMLGRIDSLKEKYKNKKVDFIRAYSHEYLKTNPYRPQYFDIIYIDGNHTIQSVMRDWVYTWPLLKDGGVMMFDDYLQGCNDQVHKTVDLILDGLGHRKYGQYGVSTKYELLWKNYAVGIRKLRD